MKRTGFTLVELSLVLVIIGLLIGGIMGGEELVNQARLQSVVKDIDMFKRNIQTFRMKYMAYPGDFTKASTYWPTCNATPANCNGNGDGIIQDASPFEDIKMWQHLSLAGLVPGGYTGVGVDGTVVSTRAIGINIPGSRITGGGYMIDRIGGPMYGLTQFSIFWLGSISTYSATLIQPIGYILNAADALSIDAKVDDTVASTGSVLGANGADPTTGVILDKSSPQACVNGNTSDATASYNVAVTDITCRLGFKAGF